MKHIYKITFHINTDFYNDVCNKLYDMRLLFNAHHCGLLISGWNFSVDDITAEEKKELISFIRKLLNDNDFRFSSSFQTGFIK